MKKAYEAPTLDVELFQLNQSIAKNCDPDMILNTGPEEQCTDWLDLITVRSQIGTFSINNFAQNSECDCYTTAINGMFSS